MTPHENDVLMDIHGTLKEVQTELKCHLKSYQEKCEVIDKRIDNVEQKEQENTIFRNKIIGVFIVISVLIPGIYIILEKWLK